MAQQRVVPWRNGGGSTREVAIAPAGASITTGFRWRISVAGVAADGPFSPFPGVDRSLWLLRGTGLALDVEGRTVRLDRAWQRFDFAGETAIRARLLAGPTEDLNVMVARGEVNAAAAVHIGAPGERWHQQLAPGEHVLLALQGGLSIEDQQLGSGDALRLLGRGSIGVRCVAGPCAFLCASFCEVTSAE